MGKLKDLRKEVRKANRTIGERDRAYERLLERYRIALAQHANQERKFIAEVKLWRDKYTTLRDLFKRVKGGTND